MEEYDDDIMSMDEIDYVDVDVEDLDLEDFDTNKKMQKTRGIVKMEGLLRIVVMGRERELDLIAMDNWWVKRDIMLLEQLVLSLRH